MLKDTRPKQPPNYRFSTPKPKPEPPRPAPEPDLPAGRRLRDEGMRAALSVSTLAADQYKAAYAEEFVRQAESGRDMNSDTIVAVVGLPPEECSPNIVGGLFNGLVRKHYVREVGMTQMGRPGAHARRTPVYRGYDPDEE